jgi:hypothetical protein
MIRRHAGLALVLLALTALAVSHRVGFGNAIVLDLGQPPGPLEAVPPSDRFFQAGGLCLDCRPECCGRGSAPVRARRRGWCRTPTLRRCAPRSRRRAVAKRPWRWTRRRVRAEIAAARTPHPAAPGPAVDHRRGGGATFATLQEVLTLASEQADPASTMYVAPLAQPARLPRRRRWPRALAPGELRLILPALRPRWRRWSRIRRTSVARRVRCWPAVASPAGAAEGRWRSTM